MNTVNFSVDAALLRELGERLVGKPYVALSELIKNAYDADATAVELKFLKDEIEISDNGHGMDEKTFRDFWMRIGSQHKQKQRESPNGRPLTGQKGVGRLAVQFLGRKMSLETKPKDKADALFTEIDWDDAIKVKELTSVSLNYDDLPLSKPFPNGSPSGTRLRISALSQTWTEKELKALALEIWALQPPFKIPDPKVDFRVTLLDAPKDARRIFDLYSQAFQNIWHAKILGKLKAPKKPGMPAVCDIKIVFDDGSVAPYEHELESCPIRAIEFQVGIYSLTGRQPMGVSVSDLRDYLKDFGGVAIYDTGFRLPFYGVDTDWLRVQLDHSRRIAHSELLPSSLQVSRGLNFLPTNARILGAVSVSTSDERNWIAAEKASGIRPLEIAITRDRLIENPAYETVRTCVRAALDFYAMSEAARELKAAKALIPVDGAAPAVEKIAEIVEEHAKSLPAEAMSRIKSAVQDATSAVRLEKEVQGKQSNLLGVLATAGIAATAFDHEYNRQFRSFESILERFSAAIKKGVDILRNVKEIEADLRDWATEFRATRQLFSDVSDPESRERREHFRVRKLLEQVVERLKPISRGAKIETESIPQGAHLPSGTFVEWSAFFQNVIANAINATLDSPKRLIEVSFRSEGKAREVLVQDTGIGVVVATSEELFEPFVQKLKISHARKGLRIGGAGLGLSIVRMIASNLGCRASFVEPQKGFKTAFSLGWSERK